MYMSSTAFSSTALHTVQERTRVWVAMQIRGYQVLGTEAAGVMRQAVSLASWLGHSQVTPLHVASTMLSAAAGPLRAACLQSQSRPPLQCKELELCLNVALNGLARARQHAPAGTSSNALVAALKRAQAHRRSRCQRQTTALAMNVVELAELTVAILDDPSVDRAMRKAGFSSSQVKAVLSSELSDSTCSAGDATSPSPVLENARAPQTPPETVCELQRAVVPEGSLALNLRISRGSDGQARQATTPGTGRPAINGSTEVLTATSIIPAWLRAYQDPVLNRSTSCGNSLQANGHQRKFTELTAENLKNMCSALEQRVPRHKEIIPGIVSTVLRCRSGMTRKSGRLTSSVTCLLFLGRDGAGKKAMAQELAKLVFGSTMEFAQLVNPDYSTSNSTLALKRQRSQDNDNGCVGTRLFNVILENPHRVILIEGADDQLDYDSAKCIKNAIAEGRARGLMGNVLSLEGAIIVLCSQLFDSRSLNSYPWVKQRTSKPDRLKGDNIDEEVRSRHLSLDLNICEEVEEEDLTDDVGILNVIDGVFLFE